MAKLPLELQTSIALNETTVDVPLRPYLGMSMIGHPCNRYLWYYLHWAFVETIPLRLQRLFKRGHLIEDVIYEMLGDHGIEVHDTQLELVGAWGFVKGHIDGTCYGVLEAPDTLHLLEIKTHNEKSFQKLKEVGIPTKHTGQMERYCYDLKLSRALYIAINKNTDEVLARRYTPSKEIGKQYKKREEEIVLSDFPPPRGFSNPDCIDCTYCQARAICWEGRPYEQNCRTCKHHEKRDSGVWYCMLHKHNRTEAQQREGCQYYAPKMVSN